MYDYEALGKFGLANLRGKTALVTGGAKGIGMGISQTLAACGANVIINFHSSSDGEELCHDIRRRGGQAIAVQADVTDPKQVESMVKRGREAFGAIHILVNNAAYQCNTPFPEYQEYQLKKIFATNLHGYIVCIQSVVPEMKEMGYGRIINISSVHSKRPTNFDPGYSMTKGAIKMLTRECALELAPYHINVNAVEYGYVNIGVKSGNPRSVITQEMKEQEHKFRWSPLCLSGQDCGPKEAAPIVAFLASEESEMVNGASVRVDTGAILT